MIVRNSNSSFCFLFWLTFGLGFFPLGTFILAFQIYFLVSGEKNLHNCMPVIMLSLSLIIIDILAHLLSYLIWIHKNKELFVFKKNKGYIVLKNITIKSFELHNVQFFSEYSSFRSIFRDGFVLGNTILIIVFDDKTIGKYELGITRFTSKRIKKYIDKYKKE